MVYVVSNKVHNLGNIILYIDLDKLLCTTIQ